MTRFLTLSLNEDDELIMDVKRFGWRVELSKCSRSNVQSEALSLTSDFAQVKFGIKASAAITKYLTQKANRVISGYKEKCLSI